MVRKWVPNDLPSSRESCRELSGPPDRIAEVQQAPNRPFMAPNGPPKIVTSGPLLKFKVCYTRSPVSLAGGPSRRRPMSPATLRAPASLMASLTLLAMRATLLTIIPIFDKNLKMLISTTNRATPLAAIFHMACFHNVKMLRSSQFDILSI